MSEYVNNFESKVENYCQTILKDSNIETWEHKNKAIIQLTQLIVSNSSIFQNDVNQGNFFYLIKEPVKLMINDLRSQQVRDICQFLMRLVEVYNGEKMKLFLRDVFVSVLNGVKVSNKVMSDYVDECILALIKGCVFKSCLPILVNEVKEHKSNKVREKCMEYLNEICIRWDIHDKDADIICEGIKIGLEDASVKCRDLSRTAYLQLFRLFPKKIEKLRNGLPKALCTKLQKSEADVINEILSSGGTLDATLSKSSEGGDGNHFETSQIDSSMVHLKHPPHPLQPQQSNNNVFKNTMMPPNPSKPIKLQTKPSIVNPDRITTSSNNSQADETKSFTKTVKSIKTIQRAFRTSILRRQYRSSSIKNPFELITKKTPIKNSLSPNVISVVRNVETESLPMKSMTGHQTLLNRQKENVLNQNDILKIDHYKSPPLIHSSNNSVKKAVDGSSLLKRSQSVKSHYDINGRLVFSPPSAIQNTPPALTSGPFSQLRTNMKTTKLQRHLDQKLQALHEEHHRSVSMFNLPVSLIETDKIDEVQRTGKDGKDGMQSLANYSNDYTIQEEMCTPLTPQTLFPKHLSLNMKVNVLRGGSGNGSNIGSLGKNAGIIRFIGHTSFASGIWIGVELNSPVGKNNGSVSGKYYFQCRMNYGLFVREDCIEVIESTPRNDSDVSHTSPLSPTMKKEKLPMVPSTIPLVTSSDPNPPNGIHGGMSHEVKRKHDGKSFSDISGDSSGNGGIHPSNGGMGDTLQIKLTTLLKLKLSQLMDCLNQQLEIVEELEKKPAHKNHDSLPEENTIQLLKDEISDITNQELELIEGFRRRLSTL